MNRVECCMYYTKGDTKRQGVPEFEHAPPHSGWIQLCGRLECEKQTKRICCGYCHGSYPIPWQDIRLSCIEWSYSRQQIPYTRISYNGKIERIRKEGAYYCYTVRDGPVCIRNTVLDWKQQMKDMIFLRENTSIWIRGVLHMRTIGRYGRCPICGKMNIRSVRNYVVYPVVEKIVMEE